MQISLSGSQIISILQDRPEEVVELQDLLAQSQPLWGIALIGSILANEGKEIEMSA
jgi:hypothetical protein